MAINSGFNKGLHPTNRKLASVLNVEEIRKKSIHSTALLVLATLEKLISKLHKTAKCRLIYRVELTAILVLLVGFTSQVMKEHLYSPEKIT